MFPMLPVGKDHDPRSQKVTYAKDAQRLSGG